MTDHKPFTDDGVTYCGFDGHEGCGELWPCSAAVPEHLVFDDYDGARMQLVALSEWIDAGNAHRDPEAVLWGRVAKLGEECGEAVAALIGATGQNPRKGVTHDSADVVAELLDVAVTALGAVEHIRKHDGQALPLLVRKIAAVHERAMTPTLAARLVIDETT